MSDEPAFAAGTSCMSHSVLAAIEYAKVLAGLEEAGSSLELEPPLGGGAGERCVKSCRPQDGFNAGGQTSHRCRCRYSPGATPVHFLKALWNVLASEKPS